MKNHVEKISGLLLIFLSMTLLISEKEIEDNNTYSRATPISLNVICSGSLSGNNNAEKDWYTFTLENAGKVNITFSSKVMANNNYNYYRVYVYGSANLNRPLSDYRIRGSMVLTNMDTLELSRGVYYILIQSYNSTWSDADYSFIVNYIQ